MFKATIPGILNKSRTLLARRFGSETQNLIAQMLFDDDVNVLTTFDMNRIASYSFGDTVCGEIFDVLEYTLRNPLEFTVLSLHKTLVLMHHLAVYASQKAANNTWILKPHVKPLIEYNTVLMAFKEPKSLIARVQRIKGGSVDRGQPVRESAKVLFDLLSDVEMFKKVRDTSADPDSLVPVGHHEQVGFVSDEVRKATLEEKLKQRHNVQIKSSLKDGGGGFGSASRTTVIGAAHSMEEMLKMARQSKVGYRDGALSEEEKAHMDHLQQLEDELKQQRVMGVGEDGSGSGSGSSASSASASAPVIVDLLDFGNAEPEVAHEILPSTSVESLPYQVNNEDPYLRNTEAEGSNAGQENDTFGHGSYHDPFEAVAAVSNVSSSSIHDPFDAVTSVSSVPVSAPASSTPKSNGMDFLSHSMGGMGMNDGNASSGRMGMGNAQSPMSAFDDVPTSTLLMGDSSNSNSNSNSNLMGGSAAYMGSNSNSNSNLMGGSAAYMGSNPNSNSNSNLMGGSAAYMGMPPAPSMQPPAPPAPPAEEPPAPPAEVPPTPPANQTMPNFAGMNNSMGGSTNGMHANNGMNGMNGMNMNMGNMGNMGQQGQQGNMSQQGNNMSGMNPMMMMGNPMMMQNAMQNMNPEQQAQYMQQMMMMNQQMMQQMMQMQNQQPPGQGQGSNNGGSNNNSGNANFSHGFNPFSG